MDIEQFAKHMLDAIKGYVDKAVTILNQRIDSIPAGKKGEKGEQGPPPSVEAITPIIQGIVSKTIADIPPAKDGKDGKDSDVEIVAALLMPEIEKRISVIPIPKDGADGKSIDIDDILSKLESIVRQNLPMYIPPIKDGKDGKDADTDLIIKNLKEHLIETVAQIPKPRDGRDGRDGIDGIDGKHVDDETIIKQLRSDLADALSQISKSRDGKDGKNGESIHPDTVARMVAELVEKAMSKIIIKDGRDGLDAAQIEPIEIDESRSYPKGTWAMYAGGVIRSFRKTDPITTNPHDAGWKVMMDGHLSPIFTQGEDPREFIISTITTGGVIIQSKFYIPTPIWKDVWSEGEYDKGDLVTWGGSVWHCQRKTTDKPQTSDAWKLMVKHGKDGKSFDDPTPPKNPVVRNK